MGQSVIVFAAAFGGMMLVSLLLCVKANLVWLRSGFAACAAVCAVGSSLNCLFIEGREVLIVERVKTVPVEPTVVKPELTTAVQDYLAASITAKRTKRLLDGLDGFASNEDGRRGEVRRGDQ